MAPNHDDAAQQLLQEAKPAQTAPPREQCDRRRSPQAVATLDGGGYFAGRRTERRRHATLLGEPSFASGTDVTFVEARLATTHELALHPNLPTFCPHFRENDPRSTSLRSIDEAPRAAELSGFLLVLVVRR